MQSLNKTTTVEKRDDFLQVPSPRYRSRLSPNKERVPIMTASRYPLSESELEELIYKEEHDPESETNWAKHLRSLVKCTTCDRAFAPDRVQRHQSVCNGSSRRLSNKARRRTNNT